MDQEIKTLLLELSAYFDEQPVLTEQEEYYFNKINALLDEAE